MTHCTLKDNRARPPVAPVGRRPLAPPPAPPPPPPTAAACRRPPAPPPRPAPGGVAERWGWPPPGLGNGASVWLRCGAGRRPPPHPPRRLRPERRPARAVSAAWRRNQELRRADPEQLHPQQQHRRTPATPPPRPGTVALLDSTFEAGDATTGILISTNVAIDWGTCAPGTTPGAAQTNVLVETATSRAAPSAAPLAPTAPAAPPPRCRTSHRGARSAAPPAIAAASARRKRCRRPSGASPATTTPTRAARPTPAAGRARAASTRTRAPRPPARAAPRAATPPPRAAPPASRAPRAATATSRRPPRRRCGRRASPDAGQTPPASTAALAASNAAKAATSPSMAPPIPPRACPARSAPPATSAEPRCAPAAQPGSFQNASGATGVLRRARPDRLGPDGASAPLPCPSGRHQNAVSMAALNISMESEEDCAGCPSWRLLLRRARPSRRCARRCTKQPDASQGTCTSCDAGTFINAAARRRAPSASLARTRGRRAGAAAVRCGQLQQQERARQQPVHRLPRRLVVLDGLAQPHAVLAGHSSRGRPRHMHQLRRWRAAAAPRLPAQLLSLRPRRSLSGAKQRPPLVPRSAALATRAGSTRRRTATHVPPAASAARAPRRRRRSRARSPPTPAAPSFACPEGTYQERSRRDGL